ncbi:MAG TPA: hypothetical protein VHY08_05960, partial [Bacillota bacterium]|nr:hypothetical protein [Bacillota bacterium]
GALLCKAGPIIPSGPVIAETTSIKVSVKMNNILLCDGMDQLLQPSTTFLDFGRVTAGGSLAQQLTLTNNGDTALPYTISFSSPSPSSAFAVSPTSGNVAGGDHVDIDVTLAPPSNLASETYYSEDLRIVYHDPTLDQDQELMVWIFGTGVVPTPAPTPSPIPTPSPTPSPILTPAPTQSILYPNFLDYPKQIFELVSFPINPLPSIVLRPTKIIKLPTKSIFPVRGKTKPDWKGLRALLTSDAKVNKLTIDDFIINSDKAIQRYDCSSLLVTEGRASQNGATVTCPFTATAEYKDKLGTTTTVTEKGRLVLHFTRVLLDIQDPSSRVWYIDNIEFRFILRRPTLSLKRPVKEIPLDPEDPFRKISPLEPLIEE